MTTHLITRRLALLAIVAAIALFISFAATHAQTPAPTPTPDSTTEALRQEIFALNTQVALLSQKIDLYNAQSTNRVQEEALEFHKQWWPLYIVFLAGAAIAAYMGFSSWKDAHEKLEKYMQQAEEQMQELAQNAKQRAEELAQQLEKRIEERMSRISEYADKVAYEVEEHATERINWAIYRADPTFRLIYIPEDQTFEKEKQRLEKLRFKNLKTYAQLPEILLAPNGIVVYSAQNEQELSMLVKFIEETKNEYAKQKPESAIRPLSPEKLAFVIYTRGTNLQNMKELYKVFDNATPANTLATMVSQIYAVSRGLD